MANKKDIKVTVSARIRRGTRVKLMEIAKVRGVTFSKLLGDIIESQLENIGNSSKLDRPNKKQHNMSNNKKTAIVRQALENLSENRAAAIDLFSEMIIDKNLYNENILPEKEREKEALILKSIRDIVLYGS